SLLAPAGQILGDDRPAFRRRNFLGAVASFLALDPERQLAGRAQVARPRRLAARRGQIARSVQLDDIDWRAIALAAPSTTHGQYGHAAGQQHDRIDDVFDEPGRLGADLTFRHLASAAYR